MSTYSVVVPVYNSEKTLNELYNRIRKVFENVVNDSFELILVDDSSKDDSFQKMISLHEKDKRVKIIQLSRNYGQHNALICGMRYTSGEVVITLDDDLQHPPEEIPTLIEFLNFNQEVDVVIGRYDEKKHSWLRNIGSMLLNGILVIAGTQSSNLQMTSFRAMRRDVVNLILGIHISVPRIGNMLLNVTNHIQNVSVHHDERKNGRSQYTFSKLIKDFKNNIFNTTIFPLTFLKNLGYFSLGISMILALIYIYRYFFVGISVQGWMTLILLQLAFGGLSLFGLGIVGEYLMRILNESKKMPNYCIRDMRGCKNEDNFNLGSH